jgi:hypothetical protein
MVQWAGVFDRAWGVGEDSAENSLRAMARVVWSKLNTTRPRCSSSPPDLRFTVAGSRRDLRGACQVADLDAGIRPSIHALSALTLGLYPDV